MPEVFGFAYLGFAVAVAIRFGAIPFHFWAARLADAAPEVTLPMLMAWGPAAFAIVALAWADQSVAPLVLPLTAERVAVVAVGAVSAVLGMVAAWIQDDLEHVVGYTIIADAGIAILGLAALDPAAWEPARTWILVFVTVRSAFAAWAVAVRGAFGTRRISELGGWAARAPILGLTLVVIAVAAVGWPGFVAWDARAALVDLTIAGPDRSAGDPRRASPSSRSTAGCCSSGCHGRPRRCSAEPAERPVWPEAVARRDVVGQSPAERAFERGGHAVNGVLDVLWSVPAAARANRALLAGVLALAVAGLGFTVAAGGLGVVEAARAVPGQTGPGPVEGDGERGARAAARRGSRANRRSTQESPPVESPAGRESAPPSGSAPPTGVPSFQPLPSP